MEENNPSITEDNTSSASDNKNTTAPSTSEKEPVKKKKLSARQIFMIVLICLVILLPFIVYLFKDLEISKLKERQKMEMDSLKMQATEMVNDINRSNIKTVARVFSWAARAEMTRDNMEQLNQIMIELAKIKGYNQVLVVSDQGNVLLSTHKEDEGKEYSKSFFNQLTSPDQVQISTQKNGIMVVSAPVFGLDKRLGNIILLYQPVVPDFSQQVLPEETKKQE